MRVFTCLAFRKTHLYLVSRDICQQNVNKLNQKNSLHLWNFNIQLWYVYYYLHLTERSLTSYRNESFILGIKKYQWMPAQRYNILVLICCNYKACVSCVFRASLVLLVHVRKYHEGVPWKIRDNGVSIKAAQLLRSVPTWIIDRRETR